MRGALSAAGAMDVEPGRTESAALAEIHFPAAGEKNVASAPSVCSAATWQTGEQPENSLERRPAPQTPRRGWGLGGSLGYMGPLAGRTPGWEPIGGTLRGKTHTVKKQTLGSEMDRGWTSAPFSPRDESKRIMAGLPPPPPQPLMPSPH